MDLHVNVFVGEEIVAAYTVAGGQVPTGTIAGRSGNAVLLRDGEKEVVVSAPRSEGDVVALMGAENAPVVDLRHRFA